MQEGGSESLSPWGWFGAVWFPRGWGSQFCRSSTDKGREVNTKSDEEERGSHAVWHSPSSPHTVVTAPAACDQRTLKAVTATAQWRGSCCCSSSRPALIQKRGEGAGGGGRRSSLQSCLLHGSGSEEAPWNGHSTVLTWRFPQEPQEFEDRRERGEACREHQRMRGAIKGTGESFAKNLSCPEMLSGEGAIICFPFRSDERSQQGPSWSIPQGPFCHCSFFFPLHTTICWPFQRNLRPPSSSWEDSS